VVAGLARTGRIVTTAAALLSVTFVAFATSSVTFLQMLGIGTAMAIVVDATVIRGVLVPAFMRLAGDANWWAPGPLRALHARIGLVEAPNPSAPPWAAPVGSGHPPQLDHIRPRTAMLSGDGGKGTAEVVEEVVDGLDADRETDQVRRHFQR
jgi:hypothetical protein